MAFKSDLFDMQHFEPVIGLEVHVQLSTQSKIFSGSSTEYGAEPNTQASVIDLGLPGTLPVLNKTAVQMAIQFGLAINANIPPYSVFDRKHYFYPDSPKGYQISQNQHPIVGEGSLNICLGDGREKTVGIQRAHLEEDAGKSIHGATYGQTGIDLNRAGVPLLEIVSKPELYSAEETVAYLKTLHTLVKYLGICDGNMQEGSFRCDVNISLRPVGSQTLGTRVECKNINSFKFVEAAIAYEIERQTTLLLSGQPVVQETRMYDANKNQTYSMRSKENAEDYRYFPDPDLLPVVLDKAWIEEIRKTLPELPRVKHQRFQTDFGLSATEAELLTQELPTATYFEDTTVLCKNPKLVANWMQGELFAALNEHQIAIEQCPISPVDLGDLILRIQDNTLSSKTAKQVFQALWKQEGSVDAIIEKHGLKQVSDDSAIAQWVNEVIKENPEPVAQFKAGNEKVLGFLMGQVMKRSGGKANPEHLQKTLKYTLRVL